MSMATSIERSADRIHSAAIHLLRRLRAEDEATGLSAPRLSALSVVVHAGPLPIGDLAAAEQVRPPTMTRLVTGLERDGLVERRADPGDGRVQLVVATERGRQILEEGRRRRVRALARDLAALPAEERALVERAAAILERLALPHDHPVRRSEDEGVMTEDVGAGRSGAGGPP